MRFVATSSFVTLSILAAAGCNTEQRMTVTATAFNSTRAQTDSRPTETACGDKLQPGSRVIAVSRDLTDKGLVCGTQVKIEGFDEPWTVADLTAARHEQLIDLYMGRDVKAARTWGRREVEIAWRDKPE
jgi:3D (Asp-Asp-Asp) domain-containing protein